MGQMTPKAFTGIRFGVFLSAVCTVYKSLKLHFGFVAHCVHHPWVAVQV